MRWGLISDVHANAPALEAVLEDLAQHGVERVLCAGDVVGYYPFPNETIDLMIDNRIMSIRGNHDRSVLRADTSTMTFFAGDAAIWTARHLNERSKRYLESLPECTTVRTDRQAMSVYHASPRDPLEYVYEDKAMESLLSMTKCSMLVLGHTHIPFVKRFSSGLIINPGSVGQPRDGDPRASYSIVDSTERTVGNHRVSYDIETVARKIEESGLPRWLHERLKAGV